MTVQAEVADLFVIGGGINGCGIARDAAGRGLSVVLCEKGDLAAGDLLGLDQALPRRPALPRVLRGPAGARGADRARDAAARDAAHLLADALRAAAAAPTCASRATTPVVADAAARVMPWMKGRRPAWLIRLGLVALRHPRRARRSCRRRGRSTCARDPAGRPLKPTFRRAFEYSDCWVEDSRLVVLNARDAAARGARILTRTRVVSARARGRRAGAVDDRGRGRAARASARARARQRRRPLGRRDADRATLGLPTRATASGWCAARTSSRAGSSTTTAATSSRAPTGGSSSRSPTSGTSP